MVETVGGLGHGAGQKKDEWNLSAEPVTPGPIPSSTLFPSPPSLSILEVSASYIHTPLLFQTRHE